MVQEHTKDKWQTTCLHQGLGPKEHMKMEQLTHLSRRTGPEVPSHSQGLFVRCDKGEGPLGNISLSSVKAVAWHLLCSSTVCLWIHVKTQPGFSLHHRQLWDIRVKDLLDLLLLNMTSLGGKSGRWQTGLVNYQILTKLSSISPHEEEAEGRNPSKQTTEAAVQAWKSIT